MMYPVTPTTSASVSKLTSSPAFSSHSATPKPGGVRAARVSRPNGGKTASKGVRAMKCSSPQYEGGNFGWTR
jgi:hypothetical protein